MNEKSVTKYVNVAHLLKWTKTPGDLLYKIYFAIKPIHHYIDCVCFILSLSFELVVVTHSCSKTGGHSNVIGCMLHKFNTGNNQSFSDLIKDFALQIVHEKIVFDASGFFSFDYGLLVSVSPHPICLGL